MPLTLATNHRRKYMSNTYEKEPLVHWGFSAEVEKIDVQRILSEAGGVGLTLFSVDFTCRVGNKRVFFVKMDTIDYKIVGDVIDLKDLDAVGEDTKFTPEGLEAGTKGQAHWMVFDCTAEQQAKLLEHLSVARRWYGKKKHRVAVVGY
jgi:hypothetical protein